MNSFKSLKSAIQFLLNVINSKIEMQRIPVYIRSTERKF